MAEIESLLQVGFTGNPTMLRTMQLLCRFSIEEAATFCCVSPETFRRWRRDRTPNQTAVKLLAIRTGRLPWPEWLLFHRSGVVHRPAAQRRPGAAVGARQ